MKQDRKPFEGTPKPREQAEARLHSKTPGVQDLSHDEISALVHELQVHQIELEMQNDALRRGQIALDEANRKYSDFYDFAPVGFLTLDESGLIREANLTAASQLGLTKRHLIDKPFQFFIKVDERNRFRRYLRRVFQETGPQPGEITLLRPNDGSFIARLNSVAVTDVSGARVCRMSVTDISDLKQAEEKLQVSERLFASFMEHLPSVAVIRDLEGRYIFANAAWEQATHKSREEWQGKTNEDLWPAEVAAKLKEQDRFVIESGEALQSLGMLPLPDGQYHWIICKFPIPDQDGQPALIGVNAINVTEAMATKARLEQVLDSGPAAIYTIDPGRNFALSYISENTKMVVGWEAREFMADSRFWLDHVHPEDRPWVCSRLQLPWPQDRQTYEYRFLAKDGAYRWMHDEVRLLRDADGKPVEMAGLWMDITDSKRAQAALEESVSLYQATLESTADGLLVVDLQGRLVSWNQKFLDMWRLPENIAASRDDERALAYVLDQLVVPQAFLQKVRELYNKPSAESFDLLLFKDGRVFERYSIPQYLDTQIVGRVWSFRNVTERKRLEEALWVSLRFLELVHNITDINSLLTAFVSEIKNYTGCEAVGIRVLDAAGGIPYQAYDGFRQQFYESESPLSIRDDHCMCINVIKGDCNPNLPCYTAGGSFYMNHMTRFLTTLSDADQGRPRNACHQEGYESVALIPIRWGDQILGLIHIADPRENMAPLELVKRLEKAALQLGTAFERIRVDEARWESEAKYRLLVNQIPAVVFKGYRDWSVDFFDRKIEHLTGYPKEEFDSRQLKWCDLILPEDLDMARGSFMQALKNDKSYVREYRIRRKNGEIAWIQARGQIFCDAAGQVDYVSGVFFDITERKAAETIIHQERQRFFSLLDLLPALVCLVAPDFTLSFANRLFQESFGDPQGRTCYELSYDRQRPCDECNLREILETRKPVEWERTSPEGRTYHVYNYPFADIDGSPMVLKLGMDITERKALEAQLLQAQKMEAVGRLAGGVAHDFNNLLMAIMGYSELIRTSLVKGDPLYKYSEDILKATERAASLTQQLLAFSRRQVTQPQVLNLNRVAADLEKMLRRLIGEHIDLEIVAAPQLGAVKADPGQINQIIMNLAVNARDAMPTGGRLILATANIDFTASHECYGAAAPPGRYVRLAVTDTGSGMDAETLDHIFEPFFTTKEVGKGTGLGLPMVYGIIKQNGGYIEVDSHPGQGATFKIYLPRIEAAVEATAPRASLAAKLEGSETILVVEDEDALRTLLCRFFRLYGYNVMEARHGGEALLLCERHPGPIHLMVTDVVMPQMSGQELAHRLAPLHPEMAVFFMSGYAHSDLTGYGAPESNNHFIPKPFRPMDLVKKVRDFLDASRGVAADTNLGSKREFSS